MRPSVILDIEHGVAAISPITIEAWCLHTHTDAAVLLRCVVDRVPGDVRGIWVDLRTLSELRDHGRLARWATQRLVAQGTPNRFVSAGELTELAHDLDVQRAELIRTLHDFTPLAVETTRS